LRQDVDLNVGVACAMYAGVVMQSFEGEFGRGDAQLNIVSYLADASGTRFIGTVS
jgi:hypothetical protein